MSDDRTVEAVSQALAPFVREWGLQLNPEDLDEMAHVAVLVMSGRPPEYPFVNDWTGMTKEWFERERPVPSLPPPSGIPPVTIPKGCLPVPRVRRRR